MEIDWSKAPEWAQCVIESEEFSGQYYWAEPWGTPNGKRCAFGSEDRALRDFDVANTAGKSSWHLIESRPYKSGLPPIGTECEAKNPITGNWNAVKVLDHDESDQCIVCREIGTDKLWWSDSFRPVKTEEEIAAGEREKAISEMKYVFDSVSADLMPTSNQYLDTLFGALYDAGYVKAKP